eukprot:TRINITY_DN3891_c0_g6_i1.p1 TRINITY_DN3891_c0_g6~~TRINITY_DN3891_c0_g6_i1.p1  ORF type:complete len:152 (+),score=32.26 TRINITY_DN3891_c0_g6_i1:89-544(+)
MISCVDREKASDVDEPKEMRAMHDKVRDLEIRLQRSELSSAGSQVSPDASPAARSRRWEGGPVASNPDVKQLHAKLERLESSMVKQVDAVNARSKLAMDHVSAIAQRPAAVTADIEDASLEEKIFSRIKRALDDHQHSIKDEIRRSQMQCS